MIDSDSYCPSIAENSYSSITIINSKDEELCNRAKNVVAKVFTQDLKVKHEDRFLTSLSTISNLNYIKCKNPGDKFISQMIIPPGETFMTGFEKLLENTLCQISSGVDLIVFGGTVLQDDSDITLPYTPGKEAVDLLFLIGNIIEKVYPTTVRFAHFGVNENYNELLKMKDYALLKSDNLSSINTDDSSRYEYDLKYLCHCVYRIVKGKKINKLELLVKYKITDADDFNAFKEATEKYGYKISLEQYKFTAIKM